jgi:hypothetical protein
MIAVVDNARKPAMEAGHPELREILESEEEIEAILGKPAPRMITKVIDIRTRLY